MIPSSRLSLRVVPLLVLAALPAAASAQLISLKTVPIATGDQFLVFPARNLGMGGLSIALDDTLNDPFSNPARGSLVRGTPFFGSPTLYNVSGDNGSGRTLPAGALFGSSRWFGGALLAFQQIENQRGNRGFVPGELIPAPSRLSERSEYNRYAFGMLGRKLPRSGVAVGASVFGADLGVVDGVHLLYPGAGRIDQGGHMLDYRLGVSGETGGGASFEAVLVHNRFRMEHEARYLDWSWDPVLRQGISRVRTESNLDHTDTWGVHLRSVQPLREEGARLGLILTGNWKSHPKIPNYELANIPRDPGNSQVYNLGVAFARTDGPATYGIDLVYEPAWSDTWAEADTAVRTPGGATIPSGGKTVENDFRFNNAIVRMGVGREAERLGFQLGLQLRSIDYRLKQQDHVRDIRRQQDEAWLEWTPTWGLGVKFPELEVRYVGRMTAGTGRPGVDWGGIRAADGVMLMGSDVLLAPGGPLVLQEERVYVHQVSVSIPVGRHRAGER
ncbi:MAG TPA: hypothetical protein VGR37_01570 [Longimicrobiaceae bacterium]|nr:hypothetical protein [Longimicrobiaceae bacterium]